jgi:hypothetical protein
LGYPLQPYVPGIVTEVIAEPTATYTTNVATLFGWPRAGANAPKLQP